MADQETTEVPAPPNSVPVDPPEIASFPVSSNTDARSLGWAIARTVLEKRRVRLRTVGVVALSNAMHGVIVANTTLVAQNIVLSTFPFFIHPESERDRSGDPLSILVLDVIVGRVT